MCLSIPLPLRTSMADFGPCGVVLLIERFSRELQPFCPMPRTLQPLAWNGKWHLSSTILKSYPRLEMRSIKLLATIACSTNQTYPNSHISKTLCPSFWNKTCYVFEFYLWCFN